MNPFKYIKIKLEIVLHKLIDSIRNYEKDKRKRKDLEQIRSKKQVANTARTFDHNFIADYYEREAKIIEDTKEE